VIGVRFMHAGRRRLTIYSPKRNVLATLRALPRVAPVHKQTGKSS
jgi:hypothetical protein